jgi:hypothetical protein
MQIILILAGLYFSQISQISQIHARVARMKNFNTEATEGTHRGPQRIIQKTLSVAGVKGSNAMRSHSAPSKDL